MKYEGRYEDLVSMENLLLAWKEFTKDKRKRKDIQMFERNLMGNIISLHKELAEKIYKHRGYEAFNISDPKPRNIHKATVRDRLTHHALYRTLYPFFDKTFISDSYSCRLNKGTQKAIGSFTRYAKKVSRNGNRDVWVLKCDVRKFFTSIDHNVLIRILDKKITDKDIVLLLVKIIRSFYSTQEGTGLPLGNLTSQLFVNVYMNVFDQFVKHKLKAKFYVRYTDDFAVLSSNKRELEIMLSKTQFFLSEKLLLQLHHKKISISKLSKGVDFLGWVHFKNHKVLRAVTKKRMFQNLRKNTSRREVIQSYLGLLKYGNTEKIKRKINTP